MDSPPPVEASAGAELLRRLFDFPTQVYRALRGFQALACISSSNEYDIFLQNYEAEKPLPLTPIMFGAGAFVRRFRSSIISLLLTADLGDCV